MNMLSLESTYSKEEPVGYVKSLIRPERGFAVSKAISGGYTWIVYHELVPVAIGSSLSGANAAAKAKMICDAPEEEITEQEVKTRLGKKMVSCNKNRDGEYRVVHKMLPRARQEDVAYYTNDLYDAFLTGLRTAEYYEQGGR